LRDYGVQVPHLFDPQRPDWQEWLEKITMRISKEEDARLQEEDRVTELGDVDAGAESVDD